MRALAPAREDRFQIGRGDAPGAVRRDGRGRAARRHRARRRLRARSLRGGDQGRARGAREAARRAKRCRPRRSAVAGARRCPPTPPPEPARDTAPDVRAISLAALDRATVPLAPRPARGGGARAGVPARGGIAGRRLRRPRDRQPLPRAAQDRRGRHGDGLRRRARRDRQGRRDQDPAPALLDGAGAGRALPARGARRLAHRAPQHHRRDRLRHDRGRLRLLRHGAPRRDRSRRRAVARAPPRPEPVLPDRDPDLPRAGRRARGRRDPPRSQAREHLPGRARRQGRLRQGARLRRRAQRGPHRTASRTRASRWARPSTWRPSRRRAASSITAATSIRSARCCTRW